MGNSIATTISQQLYPLIKKNIFPLISKNIQLKEATTIKKHISNLLRDMKEAILPIKFEYQLPAGSAIGDYAKTINFVTRFISLRAKFDVWVEKGFPDYLKARLELQTKVGPSEWSTAVSVQVQIRCSLI